MAIGNVHVLIHFFERIAVNTGYLKTTLLLPWCFIRSWMLKWVSSNFPCVWIMKNLTSSCILSNSWMHSWWFIITCVKPHESAKILTTSLLMVHNVSAFFTSSLNVSIGKGCAITHLKAKIPTVLSLLATCVKTKFLSLHQSSTWLLNTIS